MMKTRTYAEICARQGEFAQAIAIYRELLGRSPTDEALAHRLCELERLRDGVTPEPAPRSPRVARLEQLLHRIGARKRKVS